MKYNLDRFLSAQEQVYPRALSEIMAGRKTSHWMWYIFPQLKGLGKSEMAIYYGIEDMAEATAYLYHPVLGRRLCEISKAVLRLGHMSAFEIFGTPDHLKLRSCMTLFSQVGNAAPVFGDMLSKYFGGFPDPVTMEILYGIRRP